ncbi:Vicilin-like seed storage protein [Sesamum alatum]|uniref:Vicilin-like seed storage protein n=1 Tax=Sesamum alatum TaxID=300844 RepID=A0AAE2D0V3_9LAMI|nr:Vicilin-like seed storage protein [Sesamum alatum]
MGIMKRALLAAALVALVVAVSCYDDEGERWEGGGEGGTGRREGADWFLLQDSKHVVRTDAGEMRVVSGFGGRFIKSPMHIGFITMEPRSLFIPQYLDSSLILFVRRGEGRVGHIYKDELVERRLKMGDIYRIEAGSAFYLMNTGEGQRLHLVCSIDTSQSLGFQTFQSFYIAGGTYPSSVLAGFDHLTLATAFNVTEAELGEMLTRQMNGPIVYLSDPSSPSAWSKFLDMEQDQKLAHMRRIVRIKEEDLEADEEQPTWSFRKLLISIFKKKEGKGGTTGKGPDAYNLFDRKPDFQNNYGWSTALDESDYSPLKHDDIGIYLVNLTAGSMMAPHINPRAIEYGIVLRGAGTIQIVYPNGSLAMNAKVAEGDVFWIPRYFPFCQIASRTGPFEFFGFTTSARNNRPQFLVGANSLLHTMRGPEIAAAFGLSEDRLNEIINAQRESTILPSATVAPPGLAGQVKLAREEVGKVMSSFGNEMVMGFD